jgi:hypothetical protein
MKIVNLTPHNLDLVVDGEVVHTFPSDGVARLSTDAEPTSPVRVPTGKMSDHSSPDLSIPVSRTSFGAVEGLPAHEPGTIYIVSLPVAAHVQRADVMSPDVVRDDYGRVIGMRGLVSHA